MDHACLLSKGGQEGAMIGSYLLQQLLLRKESSIDR